MTIGTQRELLEFRKTTLLNCDRPVVVKGDDAVYGGQATSAAVGGDVIGEGTVSSGPLAQRVTMAAHSGVFSVELQDAALGVLQR